VRSKVKRASLESFEKTLNLLEGARCEAPASAQRDFEDGKPAFFGFSPRMGGQSIGLSSRDVSRNFRPCPARFAIDGNDARAFVR
jgi:hypothetical protein